jgi:hypothetical protein
LNRGFESRILSPEQIDLHGRPYVKTRLRNNPLLRIGFAGLLLGLLIFLFLGLPTTDETAKRIVITDGDLEQLRIAWFRRWQRNPTPEELRTQLQQYIREEVMYREALARGYDRDDPIVRRAMQQKMEFLGQSQVQTDSLTDDEIQAYFSFRRDQYRAPAVISFIHIFFNVDKRGAAAENDARSTLARVRSLDPDHIEVSEFGDRFLLQHRYDSRTEQEVRSEFGNEFTDAIFQLEPQVWNGPVPSGYGLHLVYVHHREDAYVPEWKLLKKRIAEDMMLEARIAARELFYTEILRNYQVMYRGEDPDVTGEETSE